MTYEEMRKAERSHKCAECGGNLLTAFISGEYRLRCANSLDHTGIIREYKVSPYGLPGYNMPGIIKWSEKQMMQKYGEEKTKQIVRIGGGNPISTLTQQGAVKMLSVLYPDATRNESGKSAIIKGALICRDYGLNPAMDHIFLIPYKNKQTNTLTWSVVRGIKASRLICGREKSYGYIDNTPRVMTEVEQETIFGEVDKGNLVVICKIKDRDGNEFPGYGRWPKGIDPKGIEKGNSKFNMAAIRAERQALDKLNPGAMPADVDVVDERFIDRPAVEISEEKPEQRQIPETTTEAEDESEVEQSITPEEKTPPEAVQQATGVKTQALGPTNQAQKTNNQQVSGSNAGPQKSYPTDPASITTLGKLYQALTHDYPDKLATKADVLAVLGIAETETLKIKNLAAAYREVADKIEVMK